ARTAEANGLPVVISFTVETDGRLPSGDSLRSAIERVDAATGRAPAYFMINCAHPQHFRDVLATDEFWLDRIRGLRANASTLSHAELDAATELDSGDPAGLGRDYRTMRRRLKRLNVMGGCCGTDHRHIAAICEACAEDPVGAA
ncbi:MAG TPA: homocysteine S-methyltransferase family protein, partial [Microvirga sp.]|nr:homocysteine S-methyltransferase family protein [Microvirga sp.]